MPSPHAERQLERSESASALQRTSSVMWQIMGSAVDVLHALLMAAWVLGLPILFVRRWPRLRRGYAVYAVVFIVVNQVSRFFLDECVLTTIARYFWQHPSSGTATREPREWFTVRLAEAVFHMTPSHRSIALLSELLVLVTALGMLYSAWRRKRASPNERARGDQGAGDRLPAK